MAVYVYLETGPNTGVFHLRGELGRGDNPDSFERQMTSQGLRVKFTDEIVTKGVRTLDRGQQEVDEDALEEEVQTRRGGKK